MVWNFEYFIYNLDQMGVVDVILPFVIVFTIVFAALQKSLILGRESKKFNIVIAIVMGLAVVIPHVMGIYPPESDVVEIMNSALPNISLIAVAFIMVMLLLGIIGGELDFAGKSLGGIAAFISIIAVAVIFASSAGWFRITPRWLQWIYDPYTRDIIVAILVFGVIIWFITKDDTKVKNKEKGFMQELSTIWKGPK
ncbi:MAG: hypothetical protein KJ583_01690 [Nanoarchaeota archaeon]|nr:hypothetical protein [Nanoarchaeota archaeon]MBU1269703.1 hypothetical protein [Nanoarchaeota archaeon]MBU1604004.1 hypothetical protein [Nanoarchaeota archaeon]MBU2442521.1 hypothetical protein [Nanoarchaeota archaeon]